MTLERALEFLKDSKHNIFNGDDNIEAYLVVSGGTISTNEQVLAYSNVETAKALLPSSFVRYPCYGIALWLPIDAPEEELIAAAEIVNVLAEYPVLDDNDYSEREQEAINEACQERWLWEDVINEFSLPVEVSGDESAEELRDKVIANGDDDGKIYEAVRMWALGL